MKVKNMPFRKEMRRHEAAIRAGEESTIDYEKLNIKTKKSRQSK